MNKVEKAFELAKERYAEIGVDVDAALKKIAAVPISLHCWQGDDVGGFESAAGLTGGGILSTGNYPGKARTPDELRQDAEKAFSMIPGKHRFNLHAIYLENHGKAIPRDEIQPEHFKGWIDWAKTQKLNGLDFNPTCFSHEFAADGYTLSHPKKSIRDFWIRHGICCRKIGEAMGRAMHSPCVINHWMPDGIKDIPVDRLAPRQRMMESLDAILGVDISKRYVLDSVECKLFGIGSESYVVGSHEFYMGYAMSRGTLLTLDTGHFHPTEVVADKLSSLSLYVKEFLLHVSRGVRWDSDHVVIWNDELRQIAEELVRNNLLGRTHIGLDFFDGTINRVAAWTIGTRSMIKALLSAMLDPIAEMRKEEKAFDYTSRLATLEEMKTMPFAAVWDYYCQSKDVPVGMDWLKELKKYEAEVQSKRI
ncbi:MAG: L-rhamnose isomerase [Thermoguttaceae bacterium]|nr:L-rhamnose isomerase [Thermoguttaceae bacterium]